MNKRQEKKFKTKLGFRTYKYYQEHKLVRKLKKTLTEVLGDTRDVEKLVHYTLYRCRIVPNANVETIIPPMLNALEVYKNAKFAEDKYSFYMLISWLSSDVLGQDKLTVKEDYILREPVISTKKVPFARMSSQSDDVTVSDIDKSSIAEEFKSESQQKSREDMTKHGLDEHVISTIVETIKEDISNMEQIYRDR